MCNIAGYVGSKRAAPILIDMIKREEGLDGGFYTGIATLHEGKIYYAKLTGDTDKLVALTNAAALPGTIGIIHSRTQSGGGDAWAHPFVNDKNGVPTLAYVANGFAGAFANRNDEYTALTQRLLDEGYAMQSRVKIDNPRYQILADGTAVHMSDAMCQLIARNVDRGQDEVSAITNAFCEMPSEIVGLLLSLATPNAITFSRINMPMFVGFCAHGAYVASTPTAFLDDCTTQPQALPACSSGYVTKDGFCAVAYAQPPGKVPAITSAIQSKAYVAVEKCLLEQEMAFSALRKEVVAPLFEEKQCLPSALLTYQIVYDLQKEGRLQMRTVRVPDDFGSDAPRFKLWLQK